MWNRMPVDVKSLKAMRKLLDAQAIYLKGQLPTFEDDIRKNPGRYPESYAAVQFLDAYRDLVADND